MENTLYIAQPWKLKRVSVLLDKELKRNKKHESYLFSEKQRDADEMTAVIAKLEKSINSYKEEYAQLISQAEAIKNILKDVQGKVRISQRVT